MISRNDFCFDGIKNCRLRWTSTLKVLKLVKFISFTLNAFFNFKTTFDAEKEHIKMSSSWGDSVMN